MLPPFQYGGSAHPKGHQRAFRKLPLPRAAPPASPCVRGRRWVRSVFKGLELQRGPCVSKSPRHHHSDCQDSISPGLPELFSRETGRGSGRGQAQSEGDPQRRGVHQQKPTCGSHPDTLHSLGGCDSCCQALPYSPRPHPTRGAGGLTSGRYAEILLPRGLSSGPPSPSRGLTLSFSEYPSCPQGLSCPAHTLSPLGLFGATNGQLWPSRAGEEKPAGTERSEDEWEALMPGQR